MKSAHAASALLFRELFSVGSALLAGVRSRRRCSEVGMMKSMNRCRSDAAGCLAAVALLCAAIARRLHKRRQWVGKRSSAKAAVAGESRLPITLTGRRAGRRTRRSRRWSCLSRRARPRRRPPPCHDEDSPREGPDGDRRRQRAPGRLRGVNRRGFDRTGWKPSSFHLGRRSGLLGRAAPSRQRDPHA